MELLRLGLACGVRSEEENEVVMCCVEQVAIDVHQLFHAFAAKAKWLAHEHEVGDVFRGRGDAAAEKVLSEYREFFESR